MNVLNALNQLEPHHLSAMRDILLMRSLHCARQFAAEVGKTALNFICFHFTSSGR